MIELPTCRWRSETEVAPGRWGCSSEKVFSTAEGVPTELCARCEPPLRDHPPLTKAEREWRNTLLNRAAKTEKPPLRERAWTAAKAFAKWIAAGRPRVTEEQLTERWALCKACPHLAGPEGEQFCNRCGCPAQAAKMLWGLAERPGKLEMATEECPIGKWKSLL